MIKDTDTNFVYLSDKLKEWYPDTFYRLTERLDKLGIQWGMLNETSDIWARDFMPLQLSEMDFLKYKYAPDYLTEKNEMEYATDCKEICEDLGIMFRETDIVIDGGNVTLCGDYLVMTDKVFTENSKEKYDPDFICLLEETLHHEIIFIPWHKIHEEEPFGHSDGFIHWCGGNKVLMADHFKEDPLEAAIIKQRLEEKGFEVKVMKYDVPQPDYDLNWAYINYLQVSNIILMPAFGIDEDKQALRHIRNANPDCKVEPFRMKDVVKEGGGALHCITWNIKK